jgi:hypothetical protein
MPCSVSLRATKLALAPSSTVKVSGPSKLEGLLFKKVNSIAKTIITRDRAINIFFSINENSLL